MSKRYDTVGGVEVTEDVTARLVANAEAGIPGMTPRKAGRPAMGDGPAKTVAVRLDPDQYQALIEQVEDDGSSAPQIMRDALRQYLDAA
ncbi:ribbon-helix-helix domain-containing protein [Microbacterium halotolerans]|uniref:ribbon-helix-helix domain-containing protein n=1 Tax=Microbacterium halotolerans TaxID=246613 RepID=UPI0013C2D1F5|nr:ribbon-helix-helix domain-containing protein [Microbacterium halotolerans]